MVVENSSYNKCIMLGLTAGEEGGLYQSCNSPLQIIESFLEALTNADKDGRIVINKQGKIFFVCLA